MPRRKQQQPPSQQEESAEGPRRGTKRPRLSAPDAASAAVVWNNEVWSSAIKALPSRDLLILVLSYNEETRIDEWELIECDLRGGDIRRAVVRQPQFQFTRDQFTGLNLMRLFSAVCKQGHLSSAMWIHSTFTLTADDFKAAKVEALFTDPFVFACAGGHLAVATWLYETFPSVLKEGRHPLMSNAFLASCVGGRLSTIEWLHSTFRLTEAEVGGAMDGPAFRIACRHDRLAVAKWIHATFPQILSEIVVGSALEAACEDGHLETAQWLVNTFPLVARGRAGWDAFRVACHCGHLSVAQWLNGIFAFHTNREALDSNDQLLHKVCDNGQVRIAQWLHETGFAFSRDGVAQIFLYTRYSVRRLPVVQWLHETCPHVRKVDLKVDSMFRSACECFSGDLSMVQWLQSAFQLTAVDVGLEDNLTSLTRLCCGDRILGRWLHDVFHLFTTI